jgi:ATP-binding cassette, subfamily B, bacterial
MKFRLFRQLEGMDCGPACIQMIAFHYGKRISLYLLRDLCNVTRLGVSGDDIVNGCRKLGLEAVPGMVMKEKSEEFPLPAIIHWRQNHFVVLYDIKEKAEKRIYHIADPQYGKINMKEDLFQEEWCGKESKGYAILICPTDTFEKNESDITSFWKASKLFLSPLYQSIKKFSKNFIYIVLLSILILLTNWCMPFFFQKAVDIGIGNRELSIVVMLMTGQLICFLGYSIAGAVNNIILTKVGFNVSIDLLTRFLHKIIKLPLSFFDTRLNTDLLQRMEDLRRIQILLTNQLQLGFLSLINMIVFSAVLIYYDLRIFIIFIIFTILSIFFSQVFIKRLCILNYSKFSLDAEMKNMNYELVNGMPEIKINNAQDKKVTDWKTVQAKINNVSLKTLFNALYMSSGTSFITQIAQLAILVLAAYSVIGNEITIGVMMTITYVIGQLSNATNVVINFSREIVETKVAVERVNEVYRRKDENDESTASHNISTDILISDVSFKYEGSYSPLVLHNINLSIPKGKIIAIVGASGSGKTTLMKLMLSFYKPTSGNIYLGNDILQDINTDVWRRHCGVVMQNGYIYSGSVAENIALAYSEDSIDNVVSAARLACADEFIRMLPRGYNTSIGNNGVGLSGGQIQRLLIARAVYRNPEYMFFDEATSSLDATNERQIMNNLFNFYKGRTVVIIAHRLSTVKNADIIVFMAKGRIIETGTHKELVDFRGAYYNLIKEQLDIGE